MNLLQLRTQFINDSGRFDLVVDTTDYVDNGANYTPIRNRGIEIPKNIRSHADTSTHTLTLGEGAAYLHTKLNGDAIDFSGNNRNGNALNVTWVAGKLNQAAQLNGTNAVVDYGNIANFEKN